MKTPHNLDTINELRDIASLRTIVYHQQVARYYNKNIRVRSLKLGDWVPCRIFQTTKDTTIGKFIFTWEGPYKITKMVGQGAYKLQAQDGHDIYNSWNAIHLKLYLF